MGLGSTIDAFVAYADVVSSRLADRVPMWITHNEPSVVAVDGHVVGEHAPGLTDQRSGCRSAITCSSRTGSPSRCCGRTRPRGGHHDQRVAADAGDGRARGPRCRRTPVRGRGRLVPGPSCTARDTRPTSWRSMTAWGRPPPSARATWRRSRRPPTSWASTTTREPLVRADTADEPFGAADVYEAGEYTDTGWLVASGGAVRPAHARAARPRADRGVCHRERRRVPGRGRPRRGRARRASRGISARPLPGGRQGRSPTASR